MPLLRDLVNPASPVWPPAAASLGGYPGEPLELPPAAFGGVNPLWAPASCCCWGGSTPQALSFLLLRGLNPSEALWGGGQTQRFVLLLGGLTPLGAEALLLRSGRGTPPLLLLGGVYPPSLKSLLLLRFALTTFFL